jgi:hypothetical protein
MEKEYSLPLTNQFIKVSSLTIKNMAKGYILNLKKHITVPGLMENNTESVLVLKINKVISMFKNLSL